ncbi:AAA family ATPase [Desulfosudis oleivorans]|nr:AAA family ATPase [Desulfosudis oleivorans]
MGMNQAFFFSRPQVEDKNGRFVVRKCCDYMLRLMGKRFSLDAETVEFICWLVGEQRREIRKFILTRLPEDEQEYFDEFLSPDTHDDGMFGITIVQTLQISKDRSIAADCFQFFSQILQRRRKALAGNGNSGLQKSFDQLQSIFRLTDLETELCLFLFIISAYDTPEKFFDDHLHTDRFQGRGFLCTALNASKHEINQAIGKTLTAAGLVEISGGFKSTIRLTDEVQNILFDPACDILQKTNLKDAKKQPALPLSYHFVPEADISHILSLLCGKTDTATHILLYGPPGTGKTSFAYGLSRKLNDPVYEITHDNSQENDSKSRRLSLTVSINSMNRGQGAIFIVDEADNLLNTERHWMISGEVQDKGWLNKLMDKPGLRIIWIVNAIHSIEPSVARRFAYSRHFEPFTCKQREQLWDNVIRKNRCKRFFTTEDLRQLAREFDASAGVIDMAVKKAKEAGHAGRAPMLQAVRQGIEAHQALVNGGHKKPPKEAIDHRYSLDGLNISADIRQVMFQAEQFSRHLKNTTNMTHYNFNLLLHGPPGSGKSEFARYLAQHLDRELHVRRSSDILSPYVGVAEKNIRQSFDQAAHQGAILLIDEADALLFPRANASRSWEISHTAELLTAMERFRGLLICTTNRLNGIDSAAIRRFNHKIRFDFLTPDGSWIFYNKMLTPLAKLAPDDRNIKTVKNLRRLTPGDFKIVRDRFAFYPKEEITHTMLVDALGQEATVKQQQTGEKPIGF